MKENTGDEKVTTEEAIQLEIMELDDLDLAEVTGGYAVNGGGCNTSNSGCRNSSLA